MKTIVITQEDTGLVLAEAQIDSVPKQITALNGVKVYVVDVPIYKYTEQGRYLLNTHSPGGKDGHTN